MTTFSRGIRLVSCSVALAALVPLLSGCPKKGGDAADAEAEAAVAEVAEAAAPAAVVAAATNENDVSRFPDEKKLENVAATIQRQTNVREIPGIGKVVATLAKGGTVTEIAQRSTFFLVVFDNPKDSKRVMGWVSQDAFTAQADAGL
jgi:predicted flap endonuclease-1-like 5' DNA nuclease